MIISGQEIILLSALTQTSTITTKHFREVSRILGWVGSGIEWGG